MFARVLFLILAVTSFSSADVSCESDKHGLCIVTNQKVSATDPFQISRSNGVPVTDLIITGTEMPVIPTTIFTNYPNLTLLSLASNGLNQISYKSFANAGKLFRLFIRIGFVTRITNATFRSCIGLDNLQICDHRITVVEPNAFQGLINLNSLSLSNNSIEILHPALFETLPALGILTMSLNKIKSLSSSLFLKNPELFFVEFSNNQITEIPPDLFSVNKLLSSLYFGNNLLVNAQTFGAKYTDLSSNSLRKVQINSGVQTLHLYNNFIDTIECPGVDLTSFKRVYLQNNSLTNFNCIRDMTNLTDLDVTRNKFIRPTQDVFTNMKMLNVLVMFNQTKFLKTTAKSFTPLKSLSSLKVDRLVDYRNLRQLYPNIYQVGVTTKNWNCSYQTRIAKVLNQQKITMNYNNYLERSACNIKQVY